MKLILVALTALVVLVSSVAAQASQVKVVISATSKSSSLAAYYGTQLTIQVPRGALVKLDPAAVDPNEIDPGSIVLLNTSIPADQTIVSSALSPASSTTDYDTVSLALTNINGINFGSLVALWLDIKPGISLSRYSKLVNLTPKLLSYKLFDANGNEISTKLAYENLRSYVLQ